MKVLYTALALPLLMTVVVMNPKTVGEHDNELLRYDPLVRHAPVPPPEVVLAGIVLEPLEFPQPVITPVPTPIPAPQPPPIIPLQVRVQQKPPPTAVAQEGTLYQITATYFPEQPDYAYRVTLCESKTVQHGVLQPTPHIDTGNGYWGMWQFDLQTWRSVGGQGLPSDASADEQTMRARMLYDKRGWSPWPHCGKLG